jgi:hypothetical protein
VKKSEKTESMKMKMKESPKMGKKSKIPFGPAKGMKK